MTERAPEAEIRGSTTILELLRRFPGGEAARLMAKLHWACPFCSGAGNEPLSLAAKRHANPPHDVIEAFRALDRGVLTDAQIERAGRRVSTLADRHAPGVVRRLRKTG